MRLSGRVCGRWHAGYGLAQSSTLDAVPRLAGAIAAGIVAGLTYWLVAGRNAGRWLPSEREMRESEAEET